MPSFTLYCHRCLSDTSGKLELSFPFCFWCKFLPILRIASATSLVYTPVPYVTSAHPWFIVKNIDFNIFTSLFFLVHVNIYLLIFILYISSFGLWGEQKIRYSAHVQKKKTLGPHSSSDRSIFVSSTNRPRSGKFLADGCPYQQKPDAAPSKSIIHFKLLFFRRVERIKTFLGK